MKKRFKDESDAYNNLMHNVSNSSILSEKIASYLETNIRGSVNSARKDAVNKIKFEESIKSEESMVFYNIIKELFEWDNILSENYKKYVLEETLNLMKEKHKEETQRLYGTR